MSVCCRKLADLSKTRCFLRLFRSLWPTSSDVQNNNSDSISNNFETQSRKFGINFEYLGLRSVNFAKIKIFEWENIHTFQMTIYIHFPETSKSFRGILRILYTNTKKS